MRLSGADRQRIIVQALTLALIAEREIEGVRTPAAMVLQRLLRTRISAP